LLTNLILLFYNLFNEIRYLEIKVLLCFGRRRKLDHIHFYKATSWRYEESQTSSWRHIFSISYYPAMKSCESSSICNLQPSKKRYNSKSCTKYLPTHSKERHGRP